MNKIEGYKTSKDYELLFQLMQKSSIICMVDYLNYLGESNKKDIAQTFYSEDNFCRICARGITYVWGENKEHFIRECIKSNVEFIEPTETTHA
jgi:hypothetical protein